MENIKNRKLNMFEDPRRLSETLLKPTYKSTKCSLTTPPKHPKSIKPNQMFANRKALSKCYQSVEIQHKA